jgi:hypothetical protein
MHAIYQTQSFNLVALTDTGHNLECMTVTNDVEQVLSTLKAAGRLIENHPYQRVLYCDSDGVWDEIVINGQCAFVGFRAIGKDRTPDPEADPRVLFAALLLHEVRTGTGERP